MSNPTIILHKRSSIPGAVPSLTSLSAGELAMNEYDGILFVKTIDDAIQAFLNENRIPYKLDTNLSAVYFQYGNNVVSQVLSNILGGHTNNIAGAASTIANGELNTISADFAFIGSGAENRIIPTGNFSAILGGQNNLISHANSFVIGSNLSSHAEDFTYVNNISGVFYGDGSRLTGIAATPTTGFYLPLSGGEVNGNLNVIGNTTITGSFSTVRTNFWDSAYTLLQQNSAQWAGTGTLSSYEFKGDGSTVVFNLSTIYQVTNTAGYLVMMNGAMQTPYKDYIVFYSTGTNKLSTLFIPPAGCTLNVTFLGTHIYSNTGGDTIINNNYVGSNVELLSGKWEAGYTSVNANSAQWALVGSNVELLSGKWEAGYTSVNANSASWNTITDIETLSGNWQSTYTIVQANSAQWAVTTDFTKLALSGGRIDGNILINGSLSALSGATFINTVFTNTSALQITNTGLGPALYVYQGSGAGDVASFYDGDGIEVLHVGNALNPVADGVVGINTSYPNKTLTVAGTVSAAGELWASTFYGDGSNLTGVIKTQYSLPTATTNILGGVKVDGASITINSGVISASAYVPPTNATFTSSVSAPALSGVFYGDGSNLTGITGGGGGSGVDTTKLPLSGGTLTGPLTGTTGTFTTSISAPKIYGDGSSLTGLSAVISQTQVQYLSSGVVKVYQYYNSSTNSLDTIFV